MELGPIVAESHSKEHDCGNRTPEEQLAALVRLLARIAARGIQRHCDLPDSSRELKDSEFNERSNDFSHGGNGR